MRFLCLHGMGCNAQVSEAQLAPIRQQMDAAHELVFVDGAVEHDPPAAIPSFYKGPFFCYYIVPTAENLKAAYDLIYDFIEEQGPFQGILGFSQGASLAASFLLHHRKTNPYSPNLFDVAVFACATLPFDPDSNREDRKNTVVTNAQTGAVEVREWDPEFVLEPSEVNGFVVPHEARHEIMQFYHPETEPTRIQMVTVHIMGEKDFYLPQERLVAEMCEGEKFFVMHEKDHQLPRDVEFSKRAAKAIEDAIAKAIYRR